MYAINEKNKCVKSSHNERLSFFSLKPVLIYCEKKPKTSKVEKLLPKLMIA